jgi:hypothetical protein
MIVAPSEHKLLTQDSASAGKTRPAAGSTKQRRNRLASLNIIPRKSRVASESIFPAAMASFRTIRK